MTATPEPEAPAIPGVIRYRTREPVVISAIKWTGCNEEDVRAFAGGHWDTTVSPCFVARGVTGHLFTVDADRFAATYEATIAPGVPASADTGRDLSAALVKAQARAGAAEAKLAEIAAYVHEHGGDAGLSLMHAQDILAITGSEPREEATYDRDFAGPVL